MTALEGLGEALARLRKRRRLSQPQAEAATGIDDGNISRYETSATAPAIPTLERLLDGYKASLRELAEILEEVQSGGSSDSPRTLGFEDEEMERMLETAVRTELAAQLPAALDAELAKRHDAPTAEPRRRGNGGGG
ncbi:MAG TPA: helix-turn-helix domain-containing protein [Thermoanaerobaculia bacterium]|nr:helix-turn-helix domain-containing protein [Thermoanaerobaculia bacterium]